MLAIYKRELRSFFHGMMGYVLTAFLLAASGIYFLALNIQLLLSFTTNLVVLQNFLYGLTSIWKMLLRSTSRP